MISSYSRVSSSKPSEEGHADKPLGADRLTSLPTEVQIEIVKYVIPNRGRIAVGYDYYGPKTSGIRAGSLCILRVSKHLSKIALQVLYGHRWFRISASDHYFKLDFGEVYLSPVSMSKKYCYVAHISLCMSANQNRQTRWNVLRQNIDQAHPLNTPLDCFDLLMFHTPAHHFLTRLEIMINKSMGEVLLDGKLLRALQHAKGLRLLELFIGSGAPDIMPFVHALDHIRTIKVLSWNGEGVLYEKQLARRNQSWVEPLQATGSV